MMISIARTVPRLFIQNIYINTPFSIVFTQTRSFTNILKDSFKYHQIVEKTLNDLDSKLDSLDEYVDGADVILSQGVLTIEMGSIGTYILNQQSPTKQLWLSSPISGPKRFDYDLDKNEWVDVNGCILSDLLKKEFKQVAHFEL